MNWDKLQSEIGNTWSSIFSEIIEGAEEDIKAYATEIAADMVNVAKMPPGEEKDELQSELLDQLGLLAEKNRLRVNHLAANAIDRIVYVGIEVLSKVVLCE